MLILNDCHVIEETAIHSSLDFFLAGESAIVR